jgi:hypothetical protein
LQLKNFKLLTKIFFNRRRKNFLKISTKCFFVMLGITSKTFFFDQLFSKSIQLRLQNCFIINAEISEIWH